LREEIEQNIKFFKKEIAAVLHISGKYDMELRADVAKQRGYSRTLGEYIAKTERTTSIDLEDIKEKLALLNKTCDEVTSL
jgi:hypothetical protein